MNITNFDSQKYIDMAMGLAARNNIREAISILTHAMELYPEERNIHLEIGRLKFKLKKFNEAIDEFRYFYKDKIEYPVNYFIDGDDRLKDLSGVVVIITSDSGIGDFIQLIRYGVLLKALNAVVIAECPKIFHELLSKSSWLDKCICPGEIDFKFDIRLPLHNIFAAFNFDYYKIPKYHKYISIDSAANIGFAEQGSNKKMKVGISWRSENEGSSYWTSGRAISLSKLLEAFNSNEHQLFILQKSISDKENEIINENSDLISKCDIEINGLLDTAKIINSMDLVVSTCTMIPHLAGALGSNVITLLSTNADWRWFSDQSDTPWYPLMTLLRQEVSGDWENVLESLKFKLREYRLLK